MSNAMVQGFDDRMSARTVRQGGTLFSLLIAFAGVSGCGEQQARNAGADASAGGAEQVVAVSSDESTGGPQGGVLDAVGKAIVPAAKPNETSGGEPAKQVPAQQNAKQAATSAPVPAATQLARKIVYNAQVGLVVVNLADFGRKLAQEVAQAGGYVSKSDQTNSSGARGAATWTVRVPVDRFDSLFTAVGHMGELQRSHLDTQDVSQEYYDIEARITNKKEEEKRLLKHLADSTGKLDDILAVEREVSRVRGEIEQMQGRIRYLANISALSTITITATEIVDFKPPVQPTYATQVSRTFNDSLGNLVEFVKTLILIAVAILPWVPVLLLLLGPSLWWLRRPIARQAASIRTSGQA